MIITANNTVLETETTLNDIIVIGDDFDINGYRVYQLDWWGLSKQDRVTIVQEVFRNNNDTVYDSKHWCDVKLLRSFNTGEFKIIVSDLILDESFLEKVLQDNLLPIWEVFEM